MTDAIAPRCAYCFAPLAHCQAHPCGRRLKARANAHDVITLDALKGFTTWRVTDRAEQVRNVEVAARTQAQLERSKRNVENPPPPSGYKRHGQTDALR
jgi:hypothetical protein